jgi:hypothetical protein
VDGVFAETAVFELELINFKILKDSLRVFVAIKQYALLRVVNSDVLHLID